MSDPSPLMDAEALRLAVARIAHEAAETLAATDNVVVLGIQRGGVGMARRLADQLGRVWKRDVPCGAIDGGMYRDDLHQRRSPQLHPTDIPCEIDGHVVILADDVIASGRTVRAALDALNAHGRANSVRLAVLIDRGHRELPIQPDHLGRTIDAAPRDRVSVKWLEEHGEDAVYVLPA